MADILDTMKESLRRNAVESPVLLSTSVFIVFALIVWTIVNQNKRLHFPVIKVPAGEGWTSALKAGVEKYPNQPFVIPDVKPMVILPISTLNEVRNLPEDQVSFKQETMKMFGTKFTGIGQSRPETTMTIKNDLTRYIAATTDGLQEEIRYSFNKEMGPCEDWTSYNLYSKMVRVVALLSGRVFVGRPVSRDEDWIHASIQFTIDAVAAMNVFMKWPRWLHNVIGPFLPEVQLIHQHYKRGSQLLRPVVDMCMAKLGKEKAFIDESEDEQGTMISWLMKYMDESKITPLEMSKQQMLLSFSAIHTTTITTCQCIYDLVARPEYTPILREEIESVIKEDGYDLDSDGFLKLKKSSLSKLRKLDSFLKESQRMSPIGLIINWRLTTAPLYLSTGHTIPANTRIGYASHAVQTSAQTPTFDPANNPSEYVPPSDFDGLRYYKLRAMPGNENKHQFVTTSPDSLNFGHGNHACPGRFFASNEIKIVLIELLRSWEVRLKGDVEGKGGAEKRPKSTETKMQILPNMEAEIEFRRLKVNVKALVEG